MRRTLGKRCPDWEEAVPTRNLGPVYRARLAGVSVQQPQARKFLRTTDRVPGTVLGPRCRNALSKPEDTQMGQGARTMPLGQGVPESQPQQGQHGLGAGAAGRRGTECPGPHDPGPLGASPPLPIRGPRCRLGLGSGPCTVTNKHRAVDNWPPRPSLSPEPDIPAAALAPSQSSSGAKQTLTASQSASRRSRNHTPTAPITPLSGHATGTSCERKARVHPRECRCQLCMRPASPGTPDLCGLDDDRVPDQ